MRNRAICLVLLVNAAAAATAARADQPAALDPMAGMHKPGIYHNLVLETDLSQGHGVDSGTWDLDGWVGGDMNKLWLKSEGEVTGGKTGRAELWAMYSRNVSADWDAQAGLRYDAKPDMPGARPHSYLAAGVTGLAPFFFETQAHLFIRDDGAVSARLREENEWLLTQRLILRPRLEIDLNTRGDPVEGLGAGVTDASLGLETRYEFRRAFAPYVDLTYRQKYGATAGYARLRGEKPDETRLSLGIRWMF